MKEFGLICLIMTPICAMAIAIFGFLLNRLKGERSTKLKERKKKRYVRLLIGSIVLGCLFGVGKPISDRFVADVEKDYSQITVCPESPQDYPKGVNPVLMRTNKRDSFQLSLFICNTGTIPIRNLDDRVVPVRMKKGSLELNQPKIPRAISKHIILEPGTGRILNSPIKFFFDDPEQETFYCFKLIFSHKLSDRDSVIEIFRIDTSRIGKRLDRANSETTNLIEKFLVENGYW